MPKSNESEAVLKPAILEYGAIDNDIDEQPASLFEKVKQKTLANKTVLIIAIIIGGVVCFSGISFLYPSGHTLIPSQSIENHDESSSVHIGHKSANSRPNILFIMADDLGWGDVSWHDQSMPTGFIESLAQQGVILNQSYVNMLCSPTRSAFLSGYDAYHLGTQQGVFKESEPTGVPLNFTFFPEVLQSLGYSTSLVGKWHLGYCKEEFLPTSRGFDYFHGFVNGYEDYYSHSEKDGYDFWLQNKIDYNHQGKYNTDLFTELASSILVDHASRSEKPFFLYLAYEANHSPLEAPEKYMKFCRHQKTRDRQIYCAMTAALDESIYQVVQLLKRMNLYDNTLIVFSSDGASNYPLRGMKSTLWEGGTRAISFVHSPKLLGGTSGVREDLFYITDWYATLLSLAGKPMNSYGDGINQWDMIVGKPTSDLRTSFVYNIDFEFGSAAIRQGKYKLISGTPTGAQFKNKNKPPSDGWYTAANHTSYTPVPPNKPYMLYDIIGWEMSDPTEKHDLSQDVKYKNVLKSMIHHLYSLIPTAVPNLHEPSSTKFKICNGTLCLNYC